MNTIILEKPGQFRKADTASPADAPPGAALVKVHRVGICGTDWHAYHGNQPFFTYPRILGHELAVTVESVNDPASDLKPGDKCAVEPYFNCGKCVACRRGKSNCCANLKTLGVHIDGGMRERIVVPVNKLHRSQKLSLDQLTLVEPLGIGCHAIDRANITKGEWVLVIGAGPIGLSLIPFANAAGANLIVMDISAARLSLARQQMGVKHTIDASSGEILDKLSELTSGDLPTIVIDATGSPKSMMQCFDLAAPGGTIVFVGIYQGDLTFSDPNLHRKELSIIASRNAVPANFARIIKLVEQGDINVTPWITHRVAADGLIEVFPTWLKPGSGVLKAIIDF
jgi:2-desacetyl-2-hydroxyethyl bacteriochlorophyllide A dehydrogenase